MEARRVRANKNACVDQAVPKSSSRRQLSQAQNIRQPQNQTGLLNRLAVLNKL